MRLTKGRRRTPRLSRIILTSAALLAVAGLLFYFFKAWRDAGPRPTVAAWRAQVETLAGDGSTGTRDGAARASNFGEPFGVAVARDGSVYVADAGESNRVRKLTPKGEVSTLAGGREGFTDGAGAVASFNSPSALAADGDGNLYVADTANNRIRKVTPEGVVTTLAGDGTAGFADGTAARAQFNAPVGVAVGLDGNVYVADTYNDRVRVVTKDGVVKTLAGAGRPGYADGDALSAALFDTPCGLAVSDAGDVYVADTGNNLLRKITKDGQVTTLSVVASPAFTATTTPAAAIVTPPPTPIVTPTPATTETPTVAATPDAATGATPFELSKPVGLALTHDGFLYVTELERGRVLQVAPGGGAGVVAGLGIADAESEARLNAPSGVAIAPDGSLVVADSANRTLRRLSPIARHGDATPSARDADKGAQTKGNSDAAATDAATTSSNATTPPSEVLPRVAIENFARPFPWPLDPQTSRHEVSATMGEARGTYESDDSRDHLHSGIDVFGVYGETVRAVLDEKVASPLPNWGFGSLNEGMRVGLISYIHMRVGRDEKDSMLDSATFIAVRGDDGKVSRVRVRRGSRIRVGDALGTLNRMYHVHMNLGPPGAELNPLNLQLAGFTDSVAPKIERDGIQLFDEAGERLKEKRGGRLVLRGKVRLVVDAYDQVDGNQSRRRLGLYKLGYQLLMPDDKPAPGFEEPRVTIEFDRLPPDRDATKIVYADESGITVYGSERTRFLYEVTNNVRGGRASRSLWDTSELPAGDYTLRILAADFNGNVADAGRDVLVTIERE
ncbi:MAG TPA: NHL repeat-containing protein [Pyrinomonadaceae bacterium]|nr:NHL repeat-containing protein [Pyrinomonadaceae bacterium]